MKQIADGDADFGELAMNQPEEGFYTLLQQYPGAIVLVGLATFVGLLFYVTSADSGALVMDAMAKTGRRFTPSRVFANIVFTEPPGQHPAYRC